MRQKRIALGLVCSMLLLAAPLYGWSFFGSSKKETPTHDQPAPTSTPEAPRYHSEPVTAATAGHAGQEAPEQKKKSGKWWPFGKKEKYIPQEIELVVDQPGAIDLSKLSSGDRDDLENEVRDLTKVSSGWLLKLFQAIEHARQKGDRIIMVPPAPVEKIVEKIVEKPIIKIKEVIREVPRAPEMSEQLTHQARHSSEEPHQQPANPRNEYGRHRRALATRGAYPREVARQVDPHQNQRNLARLHQRRARQYHQ